MHGNPDPHQAIRVARLMADHNLTFEEAWALVQQIDVNSYGTDDPGDLPSTVQPGVGLGTESLFREGWEGGPLTGAVKTSQVGRVAYEGEGGTKAHRGPINKADPEYVSDADLWDEIEHRLLHDREYIQYLFGTPKLSAEDRKAKEYIENAFLAIRENDGNLIWLARALGWKVKSNGTCQQMDRALSRARARRPS
jgi:hypothetical protein